MNKSCWFWTIVVMAACNAGACNVPVFRYALERWHPEMYTIAYMYDSTKPHDDKKIEKIAAQCRSSAGVSDSAPAGGGVNAIFRKIDIRKPLTDEERILSGNKLPESVPLLQLSFPYATGIRTPLWRGAPSDTEFATFIESPLKTRIVNSLLSGTTAVWVLIESGKVRDDEKAAKLLKGELEASTKDIKLLELSAEDSMEYLPSGSPELRIAFEILRVSRSDIKEKTFIAMVEAMEPPLVTMRDKPVAFAMFGRGRYLHALVGKGINTQTIQQTNRYITGPCACTVKGENPGKDMLLPDRWESGIRKKYVREVQAPKELFGLGQFLKRPGSTAPSDSVISK